MLGLTWRENLGLPNRRLEATLEARHALAAVVRRQSRPQAGCSLPYWDDAHPDHVAATQLIEAARFWAKLTKSDLPGEPYHPERVFHYYCVHLRLAAQPAFVLDISSRVARQKRAAHRVLSQPVHPRSRSTWSPPFIDSLEHEASHWGRLIGVRYGEPYASREPVGLASLGGLVLTAGQGALWRWWQAGRRMLGKVLANFYGH